MGFEEEALSELVKYVFGQRSAMHAQFLRAGRGETFVLRQLLHHGSMTPSQLTLALKASSGRISAVLGALEKKGFIIRRIEPEDRRTIKVSLTEAGRAEAEHDREQMRSVVYWIFSQMGERRTREFVDLTVEFTTYMSLCHPDGPRPTADQVEAAFARLSASRSADSADAAGSDASHRPAENGSR